MSLYTASEINELKAVDPMSLLALLNAINGSLLIKQDGHEWSLSEVKSLVESLNDNINLSDSLLDKIRIHILNNPHVVEDDEVAPTEIEWDHILITDANIGKPNDIGRPEVLDLPDSVDYHDEYDSGFPPTAEDRILPMD